MTEEHKRKIAESNKKALRKFYDANPDHRNSGMFKKGVKQIHTKEQRDKISGENSYLWKGGVSRATSIKVCIKHGKDFKHCQICKEEIKRPVIHHYNGNRKDNQIRNLGIVCYFCHNAIHDNPNKRATRFQIGHKLNQNGGIN